MGRFEMYPTIITPFTRMGKIDFDALEKLVSVFHDIGCEGVFGVCQSSEMFFLTEDEKIELAEKTIAFCRERGMKCVISGHTQDDVEDQIVYLKRLEKLKPDAIILVSNRLAGENEDDGVAVDNLSKILSSLKKDTMLGIYECPYPYKRLLTDQILDVMKADGRFLFIKDTCCRIDEIKSRLQAINGSRIGLYNANMATLDESVQAGARGYSGVMMNILPELFGLLHRAYEENDDYRVSCILEYLSAASTIECQNYPANAKYAMMKKGIFDNTEVRNGKPPLTESQIKEMDAYLSLSRYMYFSLQKHASAQLLFGYDTLFPQCHAPTVYPFDDKNVLVCYFAGEREGADDVGIWLSEMKNGEWKKPRRIAKVDQTAHWNPVIYGTDDCIHVLFKVGKTISGWKSYIISSADGGETWTEPEKLPNWNSAGGPVKNKPIILSDGRMLAPRSDEPVGAWIPGIDESTDGGKTFSMLSEIPINTGMKADESTYMEGLGAIQPTLWESEPGIVHAFLRTTAGRIFRSDSYNGGKNWCTAYKTPLPNNNSGIDIVKAENSLYLVMNPVDVSWGARTPLIVMKSENNGYTFRTVCVLSDDIIDDEHKRSGQFCYPAVVYKDKKLYIVYTYNRKSIAYTVLDTRLF